MNKELETYNEFLDIIEFPVKSHLLKFNDKPTLERYRVLRTQIETALIQAQKDKKELKEIKSAINQGTLITQWSHDYQHEKELKVLEIIMKKEMLSVFQDINGKCFMAFNNTAIEIPQEEYDLFLAIKKEYKNGKE